MKAYVLEKPTRPVNHVYADVRLDHLVACNGK